MPVQLVADDQISRCVIYPRFFREGAAIDELLWQFGPTRDDGASHESGVLRRLAPDDNDVHRIGCSIAAAQNSRPGSPPPGSDKRRYYCAFRNARYGDLRLEDEGYRLVITNVAELGEESHLDFALTITVTGKTAKATWKLDAGLALAEQFGPMVRHICECDVGDPNHPFAEANAAAPMQQGNALAG